MLTVLYLMLLMQHLKTITNLFLIKIYVQIQNDDSRQYRDKDSR